MAVRLFDLTEPQSARLPVLDAAPRRRRELRRVRRRWAAVAVVSVGAPFIAALVVLEMVH
jgi:hypothetical protein